MLGTPDRQAMRSLLTLGEHGAMRLRIATGRREPRQSGKCRFLFDDAELVTVHPMKGDVSPVEIKSDRVVRVEICRGSDDLT